MKKIWLYVGFFVLLLAGFYAFVFKGYDFTASKLGVIVDEVPEFSFVNQNGKTISQGNTDGKVYVTEYFFTTCKGICPKMNANMRRIFDAYKNEPGFMIVSHTCMPEVDSVPVLKAYERTIINGDLQKKPDGSYKIVEKQGAEKIEPNNPNWEFVTGDKNKLYHLARFGYMIDNGEPDSTQRIEDQFIHSQFFALVDKYRRVRGIYDGLKENEVQKLMGDIQGLLKETVAPKRFLGSFGNTPN
ncbi:MAG TPA: SCO family protein [Ferruginibacter sp.]|nr:SCO family protein [Ferruginibacter sp.]HRE63108.1 SCO family protein [Ferruginibacter sp.]